MKTDRALLAPASTAGTGEQERWTVVFVLDGKLNERARAHLLEELPLRAAIVRTERDGHLLVVRSTGPQTSALSDAITAVGHLEESSGESFGFSEVRMIEHKNAEAQLQAGEPVQYIGVTECAEALGVSRQRVRQLLNGNKLPQPDAFLGERPLWLPSTFATFADLRRAQVERTPAGLDPDEVFWNSPESEDDAI